ncbi:MAG: serine/threonine protein kinase [Anaerolineales bacterium]|nr:serine/threonine protein kinase [Anaerolineales bacterium]
MKYLPGTILQNRYRVDEELGRGGMAEVYKVWDNQRNVFLAMKMLREDLAEDKVFLRRFKREAHTLAALQHPNIVRFYGLEQDGLQAFMLMDFVDGIALRTEIFKNQGPLSSGRVMEITHAVSSALHYAHAQGLVHCDIKPGNILIDASGRALLTDFGIARMTDAATMTMVGAGTPAYMAPELVRGQEPTPQTDIYSLGVVLYEMVTGGERPFTGEQATITGSTAECVRWEQSNLEPPSPCRWNPDLPETAENTILKCLAKQPEVRYTAVLDLLNDLQDAFGETMESPARAEQADPGDDAPTLLEPEQAKLRPAGARRKSSTPSSIAASELESAPKPGFLLWMTFPVLGFILGALLGKIALEIDADLPAWLLFASMGTCYGLFQALALRLRPVRFFLWTLASGGVWITSALAENAWHSWLGDFLYGGREAQITFFNLQETLTSASLIAYVQPALFGLFTGLLTGMLQAWILAHRGKRTWIWVIATTLAWVAVRLGSALWQGDILLQLADSTGKALSPAAVYLPALAGLLTSVLTYPAVLLVLKSRRKTP